MDIRHGDWIGCGQWWMVDSGTSILWPISIIRKIVHPTGIMMYPILWNEKYSNKIYENNNYSGSPYLVIFTYYLWSITIDQLANTLSKSLTEVFVHIVVLLWASPTWNGGGFIFFNNSVEDLFSFPYFLFISTI